MKKIMIIIAVILMIGSTRGLIANDFKAKTKLQVKNRTSAIILLHGNIKEKTGDIISEEIVENKDSHIYLYIQTQGGSVLAGNKIIYYIQKHGNVTCVVDSYAYSMGALIATQCQRLIVAPRAELMFHRYTMCSFGQCFRTSPMLMPTQYKFEMQDLSYLTHLLTTEEYESMMEGKDIYIRGYEIEKRFKK